MGEKVIEYIVDLLIEKNVIRKEEWELYKYAVFNCLFNILPFLVIIPFCFITKTMMNGLLFSIVFLHLRRYAGGYHAKTPIRCWISSCGMVTALIYISGIVKNGGFFYVGLIIAFVTICILSPVDSDNRKLNLSEKKRYRKYSTQSVFVYLIIYVILSIFKMDLYAVSLGLGIIFVSGLQIIAVIENILNSKIDKNKRKLSFHS